MSNFIIEDHTPAPATNEYDAAVEALLKAGEGKQIALPPVPVEDKGKHAKRFAQAANRANKSPKQISAVESEDGKTVTLRYALVEKRPYTPKGEKSDATKGEKSDTADAAV